MRERIVKEVRATGCLPRYARHRAVRALKDEGVIYFDGRRFQVAEDSLGFRAWQTAMGMRGLAGSPARREQT